jgi:hypothetical protein
MYSLALIIFVVFEKKAFEHFPIGFNVNLCIEGPLFFMPIGNPRWLPPQVIVLTQNHMGKIQKYILL